MCLDANFLVVTVFVTSGTIVDHQALRPLKGGFAFERVWRLEFEVQESESEWNRPVN
jgi:hypothetical protein